MKFEIYRNGQLVKDFTPYGAYMFGTDGIPIRKTKISFLKGRVLCQKDNNATAGLTLLWPIEGFGKVMLPTTCLPEREKPYILNVELARAKLMQLVIKKEDWAFYNGSDNISYKCDEAKELFIQAIQNINDPELASRLADEALKKAVIFSEKLCIIQAEQMFEQRIKNKSFSRGCLGCTIQPDMLNNREYLSKTLDLFSFVTIPINWAKIEKEPGVYDFSIVDKIIALLEKKRIAIGAGPLLFFEESHIPDWLKKANAFEKVRESAYQFVLNFVHRYAAKIRAWIVLKGLNYYNYFGLNFEQILELTRAANMAVKEITSRSVKIIDVANPWGEYYSNVPNTIPPVVYMDMVLQSGITFDAFGLSFKFGKNANGMHIRDMMHISAILDCFTPISKPICITDLEVPSASGQISEIVNTGLWKKQWDDTLQALWLENFYKIAFSKVFIDTITYSAVMDHETNTVQASGLLDKNLKPKKSFETVKKIKKQIFSQGRSQK